MIESRELYPATKDESGKILYSRYIPMTIPPVEEDETAKQHDRNDLSRCHCCGFLWLMAEMEKGLCPKCDPRVAVECPEIALGSPRLNDQVNPRVGGGGKMGLPFVPYYDLVEYQID